MEHLEIADKSIWWVKTLEEVPGGVSWWSAPSIAEFNKDICGPDDYDLSYWAFFGSDYIYRYDRVMPIKQIPYEEFSEQA